MLHCLFVSLYFLTKQQYIYFIGNNNLPETLSFSFRLRRRSNIKKCKFVRVLVYISMLADVVEMDRGKTGMVLLAGNSHPTLAKVGYIQRKETLLRD